MLHTRPLPPPELVRLVTESLNSFTNLFLFPSPPTPRQPSFYCLSLFKNSVFTVFGCAASLLWHKGCLVVARGLNCSMTGGFSFLVRDWICISRTGRQILTHWTTREIPLFSSSEFNFFSDSTTCDASAGSVVCLVYFISIMPSKPIHVAASCRISFLF